MGEELFQEIDVASEEQPGEEKFDFSSPEDVLIEVIRLDDAVPGEPIWKDLSIETCTIIRRANPDVTGAASYDASYGVGLDYMLRSILDPPGEGWFVVVGITGEYFKGDGWMTDDDMEFYYEGIRPATEEEIKLA